MLEISNQKLSETGFEPTKYLECCLQRYALARTADQYYNKQLTFNRQPEISLFTLLHGQNSSSPFTAISAMLDPLGRAVF